MMKEMNNVRELFPKGSLRFIAGPCAVESRDQMMETAKFLSTLGVKILRGGAFKPRTSPDSFQGLAETGLKLMRDAADKYNMLVVTEVMGNDELELVSDYADILQIGSRNCQNFSLLKDVAKQPKPVLLKRGFGNTVEEFYQASRYLSAGGNEDIILVERGIRTFENSTRFTLDISAIPVLRKKVKFPIVVDPSHPAGRREYVEPLALAAVAAGADGLMVETHPRPEEAMSDKEQQLNFREFSTLYEKAMKIKALNL
ncbi:3-deoxy-7-phosphoheptulonate synthase [Cuniculiplasma divulgatum]|jgi:3-deoxy-7-phosphoheptulonate synthase|nr:3-deoxy-7-phosphoheptulonate synthase [Cuniculiplasma divulgatum]MCL4320735.1 3-deoxy-7-phosphoheptulonate synthase [Candidatus Thermoplasmatota archaeon]MCL6014685.1 3-deoxy-7-phosphoheptulonate synthase [Candidatus Thermoplasmatota archaeon]WMT49615.1 MAG: 3-deoxy-7-phosphoheptulonate synthase [Thermoplasmatales archaeon]